MNGRASYAAVRQCTAFGLCGPGGGIGAFQRSAKRKKSKGSSRPGLAAPPHGGCSDVDTRERGGGGGSAQPTNSEHATPSLLQRVPFAIFHLQIRPGWTSKGGKDRPIPDPLPPGSTPHSPQKCHVPASHGGAYCPPEEAWASACVPRRRSAEKSGKNTGPSVARRAGGTVVSHGVRHEDDPWGGHEQRDGRRAAMRTMGASQGFGFRGAFFREVFREESFWSKEIDAEGKARRKIWPNIIRGRGGPTPPTPQVVPSC